MRAVIVRSMGWEQHARNASGPDFSRGLWAALALLHPGTLGLGPLQLGMEEQTPLLNSNQEPGAFPNELQPSQPLGQWHTPTPFCRISER